MTLFSEIEIADILPIRKNAAISLQNQWTSAIKNLTGGFILLLLDGMAMGRKDEDILLFELYVLCQKLGIHFVHDFFIFLFVVQKGMREINVAIAVFYGAKTVDGTLDSKAKSKIRDYFNHDSIITFSKGNL